MATEIDKRVVEMQFDNKDFEKNCQASLTTLEKLKMALNFDGAKGLDTMSEAAKKVDFSNISKGAEAVQVKFSAMQVAGMTAISELTKGLLGLGKKIWNSSFGLMSSGGMARTLKIEQANFQMKALAKNIKGITDDTKAQAALVERMVNAASKAVSGTAYGMDAAAAVASQLMASGVSESEEMLEHLSGIAGAAAMTGRSFEDIGNIFTTVASNGRLMTMQLRQFSAAGLNLSATLGQNLGKTEAEINEMVTKGEISFQQFSKALSDAFGESAKEADNTFSGVTTNIQAQIKRIGQIFTNPFVEHVVPFLKEVKAAIQRINTVVKPLGKTFEMVFSNAMKRAAEDVKGLNLARLGGVIHGIENIFVSFVLILDTVKKALGDLFPPKTVSQLTDASIAFENFTRQLIPSEETLNGLREILVLLFSPLKMVFDIFVYLWKNAIKPLLLIITKFLGAVVRLGKVLKPFNDKLKESLLNSKFLDSVLQILVATIAVVAEFVTNLVSGFADLFSELANSEVLKKIASTLQTIGNAIGNVILFALVSLYKVINAIFSKINPDNLGSSINSLGKSIMFVIGMIEQGFITLLNIIEGIAGTSGILSSIWGILENVYNTIKAFITGEDPNVYLENIKNKLIELGDELKRFAKQITDTIKEIGVGKLLLMAFALALIMLTFAMVGLVDNASKLVRSVNGIASSFNSFGTAVKTIASYNGVTQVLIGMAIAIGAITTALSTISTIPEADLMRSVKVLGAFVAAVMIFAIAIVAIQKNLALTTNAAAVSVISSLAGFAIAIYALSTSLKVLAGVEMDFEKAVTTLSVIAGLMVTLAGVSILLSHFAGPINIGGMALIGFAIGLKIVVSALKQMQELPLDSIKNTLLNFIVLMVSFGGAMALAGLGGIGGGAFLGFLGAALSMMLIIKIIDSLADYDYNKMKMGLINMALMFSPLIGFMILAASTARLATGSFTAFNDLGRIIASFALLIGTMAIIMALMATMDSESITKGTVVIMIISNVLQRLFNSILMPLTGGNFSNNRINLTGNAIKGVKGIILSLAVLMGALALFIKSMGTTEAVKGVIPSMIILGMVFSALMKMFKELNTGINNSTAKVAPILAVILGMMSILSVITFIAAFLKPEDIANFAVVAGAITLIMAGLSILLKSLAGMNHATRNLPVVQRTADEVLIMCLGISAIIAAIAGVVYSVSKLAATPGALEKLTPVLIAMAGAIAAIVAFMIVAFKKRTASAAKNFRTTATGMTVLMLGVAALMATLAATIIAITYVTKDVDTTKVVAITASLGVCFAVLLALMALILTKLKPFTRFSGLLINSALSFTIMAAAFGLISAAIVLCVKSLSDTPWSTTAGVILAMLVPFAAIIGAIIILLHISKKMNRHNAFAGEMYSIGVSLLAGAAAFGIIASAMALLVYASSSITSENVGAVIGLWAGLLASFAAIFVAIYLFVRTMHKYSVVSTDILILAASITVAATAFLVIASSFALLASVSNTVTNTSALTGLILGVCGIAVLLLGSMVLALLITGKYGRSNWRDFLALGASVTIASTAILIIAQAIKSISKNVRSGNMAQVEEALNYIIAILIILAAIMAEIGFIANSVAGVNFLAIAVAFPLVASSLVIVAVALQELAEVCRSLSPGELAQLGVIIAGMVVVFGTLAALGSILSVGAPMAITGVIKFVKAFAMFEIAILAFAAATNQFVDAIIKINDSNLDADKIAKNASNAIQGVVRAIKENAGAILAAVSIILVGIMAILGAQKIRLALQAVAFVTAFIIGLSAAMPLILTAVDTMLTQILEKLENDPEMADRWERAGKAIGELLVHGLLGAFLGIGEGIAKAIVDAINYVRDVIPPWLEDIDFSNPVATAESAKKIMMQQKEWTDSQLEAEEDTIDELKDLADKSLFGYDKVVQSKTEEDWMKIVDYINKAQKEAKAAGYEFTQEWYDTIDSLRIPPEYLERIEKDTEDLSDAMSLNNVNVETTEVKMDDLYGTGAQEEVKTMTKNIEETNSAIEDTGTKAEESSDIFSDTFSKISEQAKDEAPSIGNNLIEGLTSAFGSDGILGGLNDSLYTSTTTNGLKDMGFDVGDVIGNSAGKAMDEDIKTHLEYWSDYANEIINPSLYQHSGGKQGLRWQSAFDDKGNAFKNADEMANYKWNEYLEETNNGLTYGQSALEKYGFGLDEVTAATIEGTDSTEAFGESLEGLGDSADKTKSKLEEFRDGVRDSIASAMHNIFDEVSEQEYIDPDEMLYRMEENTRRVGEWARNIAILAARGMSEGLLNELKDMGPQGAAKVQAFVDMTDEQLKQANRRWHAADFLPDYGTKEIEQAYRDAGFNASLGFAKGIDPTAANENAIALATNTLDSLEGPEGMDSHSPSRKTMRDGEYATEGFAIGLTDAKSQSILKSHMRTLSSLILDGFKTELKSDIFKSIGINVVDGLSNGIDTKAQSILTKVRLLATQIASAFANVLAIRSPSRVMAELGEYTMEGLSIGMEDGSSEVEKVTEQTANDILNQMKEQIAAITNGWSEDNAYQPVIRPVFDMEGIQTGYNDIQSWFANSQGLNLSGNLTRLTPTTTDDSSSNQQIIDAINNINNDDVVREIGNLRNDILDLQSAMTNLQVVMNTGALVGQLVDPIDSALGMKSLMNTRGRY